MLNFYRQVLDATPDAILISDKNGIITFVNHQAAVLLGYEKSQLINQCIDNLLPYRFLASHALLRKKFIENPSFRPMGMSRSVLALCNDGSEIPVDICLSFIQTDTGILVVSALRDVSWQKKIESDLRISEQRFRLMADASPSMIWITDLQGTPSFVNKTWLDFTGISLDKALTHEGWNQAIHDDDKESAFRLYYKKTINGKHHITTEYRLKRADGNWRWILDNGVPFYDEHHVFCGYIGSAIDITERKQAEVDFRIAATAFESQESLVITDTQSIILRINKAFTESTGYTEAEAVGQKISLLKSGRHDAAFYEKMWVDILDKGSWQGEIWDRRKNGEIYPKWLSITGVKDEQGIVTHYVGTHVDITERKAADNEIKKLAFYDPLTNLPNRRLLQERLKHGINVARREGKKLALLMLDLDRFKAVNDSFGHLAGDELLQQVAGRITARLRDVDLVARLGGDEFMVLLEDMSHPDDAVRVAEEIIMTLSQPFDLSQSVNVKIGASIGISIYSDHGDSSELLIDHADIALYKAKEAGRGCFAYFSADLTAAAQKRMSIEIRLRNAVKNQELHVFFQPQVDIANGSIIGAEALIRWFDPIEGLIMPSEFIHIAEETGLIVEIGEWVLRETCRQGRQWLDDGLPPLTLAVNVSSHQFRRSNFCTTVAKVLAETGFPAHLLELEITESGLMEKQLEDTATNILNKLHAQGVRLAIDDFGTGYSSLAYLKHFPLDVLKIDKSFIDDIPHQQDDMEIAATIVAMGHILGFKVLAEGVETPEQLAFLQEKGCDTYQGYIKSKPVAAHEFLELLRNEQYWLKRSPSCIPKH
jgi:diguanylate cyclase (GGDEF)-like protein/PAS domain S-box-containing protein